MPFTATTRSSSSPTVVTGRTGPKRKPTASSISGSAAMRRHDLGREPRELLRVDHEIGPQLTVRRRTDAFADSPKIATISTSARPITSALAVAAVRRGFRMALPRAICSGDTGRGAHRESQRAGERAGERGEQHDHAEEHEQRADTDDTQAWRARRRRSATGRCRRGGSGRRRQRARHRTARAGGTTPRGTPASR